ncbi:MAG: uncharacterized protein QOH61_1397 [Chloroflexota bacterium]|jgi:carbon monoxide dehydrogenase subunit G|nr:uncharacterized protein [Chloroflexota bacterium]
MHFAGTARIRAPRDEVWAFVIDPQKVAACGPGVESVEVIDATHFKAIAKVGVGYISARFTVNLELAEQTAPERAVVKGRGQAPGSAVDGVGTIELREDPDGGTVMDWQADVTISGMLASVGARLIEGTADKLIGQTFACFQTKLEA